MARLIDADALEGYVLTQCSWYDNRDEDEAYNAVADAPTVDAEPVRRGKWDKKDNSKSCSRIGDFEEWYECSVCEGSADRESAYCPHCGASMGEVSE